MKYGYARVSTDGQSVDAQVRQLTKAGCKKVFREVASGAKTDRAQLRRLLDQLEAGDVLTVTRLDRLARSTRDLLNTLAAITGKKAGFRSLGDTWADTTTSHGRLMLTVLGGLAEFERDLIRARTGEGRERAEGARREDGPQAEAHPAPDEGSTTPPRCGRAGARYREKLQRLAQHDFEAGGVTDKGKNAEVARSREAFAVVRGRDEFSFDASDCRSLMRQLRSVGRRVGPRSGPNKRTKDDKELFCFRRYMATLAFRRQLVYPCSVRMGERPDFMVRCGSIERGLEITEATTKSFQKELTARVKPRGVMKKPAAALLAEHARNVVSDLDDGWAGDAPERAWCEAPCVREVAA